MCDELFKIGIAEVDYTPEIGLPLRGNYRGDDYASRGIHDPLCAKAIVIANSTGTKIALLTIDINMFVKDNVAIMKQFVASKSDLDPDNILIATTHTHSGPSTAETASRPKASDNQINDFLTKAASAIILANNNLKESKLAVGYNSENRVSFNRALKCKDSKTHMNWEGLDPDFVIEPLGPIDPQMITVTVEQEEKEKAAIVNFGLHPAILAGDNWLYSADFPGYLSEAMRKIYDPEFTTLFFNGCCGNVNHIDYSDITQGRGYQMTQRIGHMLAIDAAQAMKEKSYISDSRIAVSKELIPLDRIKITQEQLKWCGDTLEKAKTNPAAAQEDGLPDEYYAQMWLDMHEIEDKPEDAEVMTIRIGDMAIVGLPGESFCQFGMEIKQKSPAKHTIVIELANDGLFYFPTMDAFKQNRYETTPGSTLFEKGAGEKLVKSALSQLNKLYFNSTDQ